MIDLHCHLLFDIDDGAQTLDEAIAMSRLQENQGVSTIVVTPHFNPTKDNYNDFIEKRANNLNQYRNTLSNLGVSLNVLAGCEVYFTSDIFEYDLRNFAIENTDYILVEFSTRTVPGNVVQQMSQILNKGFIPIIAHIERYPFLKENLSDIVDLVNLGVLLQVNADTFINQDQKSFINACVKHNLIHLVASDSHSIDKRKPNMGSAIRLIEKKYGKEFSEYLRGNAKKVIENSDVDVYQPTKIQRLFGRFI